MARIFAGWVLLTTVVCGISVQAAGPSPYRGLIDQRQRSGYSVDSKGPCRWGTWGIWRGCSCFTPVSYESARSPFAPADDQPIVGSSYYLGEPPAYSMVPPNPNCFPNFCAPVGTSVEALPAGKAVEQDAAPDPVRVAPLELEME